MADAKQLTFSERMNQPLTEGGTFTPAMGMMGISLVSSFANSYLSSRTRKKTAKWASIIAEENQRMATLASEDAQIASQYRVGQISMKTQKIKSSQIASMAANGIVVGEGTAAEILTSTDVIARESMNVEEMNGYRAAWGLRTQALGYAGQASSTRASAKDDSLLTGLEGTTGMLLSFGLKGGW